MWRLSGSARCRPAGCRWPAAAAGRAVLACSKCRCLPACYPCPGCPLPSASMPSICWAPGCRVSCSSTLACHLCRSRLRHAKGHAGLHTSGTRQDQRSGRSCCDSRTPSHRPTAPPPHPLCHPGRPPFRARTREEAERFFVDSLDAWRQEQGLDKMVLMGECRRDGVWRLRCYRAVTEGGLA